MATERQVSYILSLTKGADIEAINAYGLGLRPARELSDREASEMIDHLTGKPHGAATAAATKAKPAKKIGTSATAPAKIGQNIGGRLGKLAGTKKNITGLVVNDAGERVDIQFADGSYGVFLASFVTFA